MPRPRQHQHPIPPIQQLLTPNNPHQLATTLEPHTTATKRTIHRWINQNGIPDTYADQIATNLGTHPALIWPDTWWTPTQTNNQP